MLVFYAKCFVQWSAKITNRMTNYYTISRCGATPQSKLYNHNSSYYVASDLLVPVTFVMYIDLGSLYWLYAKSALCQNLLKPLSDKGFQDLEKSAYTFATLSRFRIGMRFWCISSLN
jgi:hypothetical protein